MNDLYGDRLEKVFLFGSHARGEANQHSDIDVLVVLSGEDDPDLYRELVAISEISFDLSLAYEELIGTIVTTSSRFEQMSEPLYLEVLKEGILI